MDKFQKYPLLNTPFAANDSDKVVPAEAEVQDGFPVGMTVPASAGGLGIGRHYMNGMGYLATLGVFLDRIGYPYGYNPPAGGYPKGAIISIFDDNSKTLQEYISLIDDNTANVSDDTAWKPHYPREVFDFLPDLDSRTLVLSQTYELGAGDSAKTIPVTEEGWFLIKRTMSSWEFPDANTWNSGALYIGTDGTDGTDTRTAMDVIRTYEGETASRLLPLAKNCTLYYSRHPSSGATIEVYRYPFALDKEAVLS